MLKRVVSIRNVVWPGAHCGWLRRSLHVEAGQPTPDTHGEVRGGNGGRNGGRIVVLML